MERVKIFAITNNVGDLEQDINDWLSSNNVEVVSRKMTSAAGIGIGEFTFVNFAVAIFIEQL